MIAVTPYSDSERVRGVLGLTFRDVSDDFISSRKLDEEVFIELFDWIPDHETLYTSWVDGASTAAETQNARLLRSYATYMGAYFLCSGLSLLAQRAITDSKMGAERFSNMDFDKLRASMQSGAGKAQKNLGTILSLATPTAATVFSSASPNTDPVTGS